MQKISHSFYVLQGCSQQQWRKQQQATTRMTAIAPWPPTTAANTSNNSLKSQLQHWHCQVDSSRDNSHSKRETRNSREASNCRNAGTKTATEMAETVLTPTTYDFSGKFAKSRQNGKKFLKKTPKSKSRPFLVRQISLTMIVIRLSEVQCCLSKSYMSRIVFS